MYSYCYFRVIIDHTRNYPQPEKLNGTIWFQIHRRECVPDACMRKNRRKTSSDCLRGSRDLHVNELRGGNAICVFIT